MTRSVLLTIVGDVFVHRDDVLAPFEPTREALAAGDVLIGNCEGVYTSEPHMAPSTGLPVIADPSNAKGLGQAGFDVMAMANNHIVDGGHEAMLSTRDLLRSMRIATCGVGRNLDEAREHALVERNETKLAFLSYASVFPNGYEARTWMPGLAPFRSHNVFTEHLANYYGPGIPPDVSTIPYEIDVQNLAEDIARARENADVVIASFHWGDFERPFTLTDHERKTARLAIDKGADVVIGHHHHILRGIEWYEGKPIFYGVGHFVFDCFWPDELVALLGLPELDPETTDTYGVSPRKGWPYMPLHGDSHMTAIFWARITDGRPTAVGFLPCMLDPAGHVSPVPLDSDDGRAIIDYVRTGCESQGLGAELQIGAGEELGGYATVRVT